MDIREDTPIPPEYSDFRAEVRTFIRDMAPKLRRSRGPQDDREAADVRNFIRAMRTRGYGVVRFDLSGSSPEELLKSRVVVEECIAAGVPMGFGTMTGVFALSMFGTDEQKAKYLPRAATGDDVWCQLFSEPDAGSDLASLRTAAVKIEDSFSVTGSKIWSSYARWADYGFLLARTGTDQPKQAGITSFVVPMNTPGITVAPLKQMTGDSDFNQVFFDDVVIPADNVIGAVNDGWRVARATLEYERASTGGVVAGARLRGLPAAKLVSLARSQRLYGRPASENASVRQDVAHLYERSHIMQSINFLIGTKARKGTMSPADPPAAKVMNSELNLAVNEYGARLFGNSGVFFEPDDTTGLWSSQDSMLFARAATIGGGTNEINKNVIAERGLGLPREKLES